MPTMLERCWEWTGGRTTDGYGHVRWEGKEQYIHRLVMDAPSGLVVDHLCRNPSCYNPSHLEVVTQRENLARGIGPSARAIRDNICINGHPFDEANTYIKPNGMRNCRTCRREAVRRHQRTRR